MDDTINEFIVHFEEIKDETKKQNAKTIWQERLKLRGQLNRVSAKVLNYWIKEEIFDDHENFHKALSNYEPSRSLELGKKFLQ